MQRILASVARTITFVLTIFLVSAFFSINAFAAKTTVSVTNDTPYPLRAVFRAVGCVQIVHGSADGHETPDGVWINNTVDEVCAVKYVAPGATVSYEFGGGTSGRKVWAELDPATSEMLITGTQTDDATYQAAWNGAYVGNSAIVKSNWSTTYDVYDDGSNSCAVKGFGILHDAKVTWTKIEVHEACYDNCRGHLFKVDCGSVVSQPQAEFVSVGECESSVRNRLIDSNLTFLQQVVGVLADDCTASVKNHGQVVSCITQGLNTLVMAKVITGAEKGAITACAAQIAPGGK